MFLIDKNNKAENLILRSNPGKIFSNDAIIIWKIKNSSP
jgi:hypothetical protein